MKPRLSEKNKQKTLFGHVGFFGKPLCTVSEFLVICCINNQILRYRKCYRCLVIFFVLHCILDTYHKYSLCSLVFYVAQKMRQIYVRRFALHVLSLRTYSFVSNKRRVANKRRVWKKISKPNDRRIWNFCKSILRSF